MEKQLESTQTAPPSIAEADPYQEFKAKELARAKPADPVQPPETKEPPSAEGDKPKETAADPDTAPTQEEKPAKKKPERKPDAEHRIEELLREKRERDERIAALERENTEFRNKSAAVPRETPPATEKPVETKPAASDKPRLADFTKKALADPQNANRPYEEVTAEAQESWEEAIADWRDKRRETETKARSVQERTNQQAARSREKYTDFDAIVNGPAGGQVLRTLAPPAVLAFRDETDNGTDVLYHLAANPAELARIAAMTPFRQVGEVLRLAESLKAPAEPVQTQVTPEKSNVRPITRIPAPAKHVLGGGVAPEPPQELRDARSYEEAKEIERRRKAGGR